MNMHGAHIAAGSELFEPLAQIAERNGFAIQRSDEKLQIDAPLGRVSFEHGSGGTRIELLASTPAELQILADLYAQRLANVVPDAAIVWDVQKAKIPLNQVVATVESITKLSPNFARLRLKGDFSAFAKPNAGLHFRFLLNPTEKEWPSLDKGGLTQWPGGIKSWHRPPYTVRRLSKVADWIDVDIVLHNGGRVTQWCENITPGDEVAIHGPSGSKQPNANWLGLFGDETALPVILRIIENAPLSTQGKAVIAVRDPDDAQTIPVTSGIDVTWVDMADHDALLNALRSLDLPAHDRHVLFAAERKQSSLARVVMREIGLSSSEFKAASYWTSDNV